MTWGPILIAAGVGIVSGLAVRRWWLIACLAAIAGAHAIWLSTGEGTAQNSPGELVWISAVLIYAPLLSGAAIGTMIGRLWQTAWQH